MRNLEVIENDLATAREALSSVQGTPAEVYSRIVGYYRSVRNWNLGKREEYGERRLYRISDEETATADTAAASSLPFSIGHEAPALDQKAVTPAGTFDSQYAAAQAATPLTQTLLLLFVRSSCPNCSPAKDAAEQLGIPVHFMNADTEEGRAEALRRKVLSTPTAILLSPGGDELARAVNAETIGRLLPV